MTNVETRLPCPVCLGVTMQLSPIEGPQPFTLDHCTRCGGAWFDTGEVQQLRQCDPQDFWKHVTDVRDVHQMQCHSCSALLERDAMRCDACGWNNQLDCPRCQRPLTSSEHGGLKLDACKHCRGVWFDRHEFQEIWTLEFSAAVKRGGASNAGLIALDVATDPFVLWYGADAAGHLLGAGLSAAPEVIGAVGEGAASVFEVIVDIISSFFD
ncbi:MAG TPA: zf-TFIIB domain-containing protein [Longimicrobiales bacterium]|nr:zf-TFIIB domain-containing protein [Longimicrobiales bacterium]